MLLRPKKSYQIPVPGDLQAGLVKLDTLLPDGSQDELTACLHEIFKMLWLVNWIPSVSNPLPDPTIRFMALHSLRRDGGMADAKACTSIIAKFERGIRLACLKEIHSLVDQGLCVTREEACCQVQPWFTEKIASPFNSLRSLQHRASSIAYTTMSLPRLWWTDRKHYKAFLYQGTPIHVDQLRQIFLNLESDVVELWKNKILMGQSLRSDYVDIAEDLTNKDVNYSFLSDHRNKCFHSRDRLLEAILTNPTLRLRFIDIESSPQRPIWNKPALRTWLYDYAQFQLLQLVRCEMLSGAPGRGTELTAMCYRNTKTRPTRNLCMLGSHLTLLRMYHKSGGLSGTDKLIPHSLDAVTADLVIQDLSIARPFAEIAVHIVYPDREDICCLYQERLFVHSARECTTSDISSTMARYTNPVIGRGLGLSDWRHLSAGLKRKLCPAVEELYEGDEEMETAEALQHGHNRATENRIYGLSPDALAGASEDVLPLFLDVSTHWAKRFQIVPGGLGLPYEDALASKFHSLVLAKKFSLEDPLQAETLEEHIINKIKGTMSPALQETDRVLIIQEICNKLLPAIEGMMEKTIHKIIVHNIEGDKSFLGFSH